MDKFNEQLTIRIGQIEWAISGQNQRAVTFKDKFYDDFKGDFDDPFEKEANIFASEILMPSKAFLRLAGSKVGWTEYDLAVFV